MSNRIARSQGSTSCVKVDIGGNGERQPSVFESLGLVLIEAWANDKRTISADIEVSRKLVEDSVGGIVTRFGDNADLAQAIEKLLFAPMLQEEMEGARQKAARAYDGGILWPRNAEVFEQLVPHNDDGPI